MSALPSPSGSTSGPERPGKEPGASRHSHRSATEPAAGAAPGDQEDGAWFAVVLRGYDRGQVESRLADLDHRIHDEIRRAESAERALAAARAQVRRLQEQFAADTDTPARRPGDAGFGRRVERVLQAAEQEAEELRERASTEAEEIVSRARTEAEQRHARTEEALLVRAAGLDREFDARRAELDERDESLILREADLSDRERSLDERLAAAREETDRIVAGGRADAERLLRNARTEADDLTREAERTAEERRSGAVRDVERLTALRDDVRGELRRVRESLAAELDREPVAAQVDDALFGPAPGGDPVASVSALGSLDALDLSSPAPAAPDAEPDDSDDADDSDTTTGTLLLGPGRRPGTGRGEDPERTTISQIPPISLSSIGVLPFGDLGTDRDEPRTRTDGAAGTSRTHRGPTRGPGSGRRSR